MQVMDQEVEVLDVWYKDDVKFERVINRWAAADRPHQHPSGPAFCSRPSWM